MPRLFLCEKPSQARDIAKVLGVTQKKNGYWSGSEILVTWTLGHLLEMAAPEDYDAGLKQWSLAALPIIPDPWRWKVRKDGAAQYRVIAKLLKTVDEIVIATDADREGEAIAREILEREGWRGPSFRLWLSALDEVSIRKALSQLLPGNKTQPLYEAAVARSKADWLVGMNLSRAYTLSLQAAGIEGVMSVGRVQTPTLKLVVDRDRIIENFVPQPFYEITIQCQSKQGDFIAHWQVPSEIGDTEGRCLHPHIAELVVQRVQGQTVTVISAETQLKQAPAPLTFDLSTLQLEASKRFGFGAQKVLDVAQALYETHKAITYPRSDSAYLPVSQHAEAPLVFQALSAQAAYRTLLAQADATRRSRVWNDQKVSAHHAVIPTQTVIDSAHLSADEQKLYDLIVRHYLAQFYPEHHYQQTSVILQVKQDQFKATGKVILNSGWTSLFTAKVVDDDTVNEDRKASPAHADSILPALLEQDSAFIHHAVVETRSTKAPPHFTEGTLIQAMKHISRFVSNPALKNCLKDTAGLGTEATRAGIIETLLKRGFISSANKKSLVSSATARTLIDALPESVSDPAMTAIWEQALDEIAQGYCDARQFVLEQTHTVTHLIHRVRLLQPAKFDQTAFPSRSMATPDKSCPECEKGTMVRKQARKGPGKGQYFLACNQYPVCQYAEPCN